MVEYANLGCQVLPFQLKELENEWELSVSPNLLWQEQSPTSSTYDGWHFSVYDSRIPHANSAKILS